MRVVFIALCLCLLGGCGPKPAENVNPDEAGPALRTALEAWKSGKSQQDLADQVPSIIMNEDDWRTGKRLLDFQIDEKGSVSGRQVVWKAQLKLQDKDGKPTESKATYVIDTIPQIVIVRNLFARH
jgi:hypothetical protein